MMKNLNFKLAVLIPIIFICAVLVNIYDFDTAYQFFFWLGSISVIVYVFNMTVFVVHGNKTGYRFWRRFLRKKSNLSAPEDDKELPNQ